MTNSPSHKRRKANARRRGIQPGNLNALKHRFYSRQFQDHEQLDLDLLEDERGLSSEINMKRVTSRQLFELVEDCQDPEALASILNTLDLSSSRLATAMKVYKQMTGGQEEMPGQAISQALTEVTDELKLKV